MVLEEGIPLAVETSVKVIRVLNVEDLFWFVNSSLDVFGLFASYSIVFQCLRSE